MSIIYLLEQPSVSFQDTVVCEPFPEHSTSLEVTTVGELNVRDIENAYPSLHVTRTLSPKDAVVVAFSDTVFFKSKFVQFIANIWK